MTIDESFTKRPKSEEEIALDLRQARDWLEENEITRIDAAGAWWQGGKMKKKPPRLPNVEYISMQGPWR